MAELTKADVRDAMRDVLMDRDVLDALAPLIEPIIARVVLEKMTDKIDKTFGLNCTDHIERQETRMDMHWLRKEREWAESKEGRLAKETFKRLAAVIDSAASGAIRGLVYFLLAGAVTIITIGAATHKNVRQLLGF